MKRIAGAAVGIVAVMGILVVRGVAGASLARGEVTTLRSESGTGRCASTADRTWRATLHRIPRGGNSERKEQL